MLPLLVLPTREALMQAAAERLEEALSEGLAQRGAACAALSGGTTPEPAYALLAARPLNWKGVTFALVDERFAPPTDPASNEGMLRRALAPALEQGARLLPMWFANTTPRAAAARANIAYAPLEIAIALMGMGADGHTASWFPGAEKLSQALDPENPHSVMALDAPEAAGRSERITLTLAAVARARNIVLLFTGPEKFARFTTAVQEDADTAPIAALARAAKFLETIYAP